MQLVARGRKPKSLLEVNVLLAARTVLTDEERSSPRRLPLTRQAQVMLKAMPKATRVAEFIALWTITKNLDGIVTIEGLSERWGEPVRTMYRRLDEFREVWSVVGYETPDAVADHLIADYRRRQEELSMRHVARLLGAPVQPPPDALPWVVP